MKLLDLGERNIITNILKPRYSVSNSYFGNDCSIINNYKFKKKDLFVITTDPCPEPMAKQIGFDNLYYYGGLLATINLSDIASSGAKPLALLTSIILPNNTTVESFNNLLDGIDNCCKENKTMVIGGNIKEGKEINISATAIGVCNRKYLLSRKGSDIDDDIIIIGDLGLFWAGVLALKYKIELDEKQKSILLQNILTPKAKVKISQKLAKKKLIKCCMDNSDGLYPSFLQLADDNKQCYQINLDNIEYSPEVKYVSEKLSILKQRMAIGWGDWQLIVSANPKKFNDIVEICRQNSVSVYKVGKVIKGNGVLLEYDGKIGRMIPLDSQRFTNDSWFTSGIDSYINSLIKDPLIL